MNKGTITYRICSCLCRLFFKIYGPMTIYHEENVPLEGPVCLMPNHVSFLDPPAAGCQLKRQVFFMAKSELFKIPVLGPVIKGCGAFPVTRGTVDRRALAKTMELLNAGEAVNIFPEGKRSKDGRIGEANKGSIDLALKYNAVIIPVYIKGTDKSLSVMNPGLKKNPIKVFYGKSLDTEKYRELPKNEMLDNLSKDWKETVLKLKSEAE